MLKKRVIKDWLKSFFVQSWSWSFRDDGPLNELVASRREEGGKTSEAEDRFPSKWPLPMVVLRLLMMTV